VVRIPVHFVDGKVDFVNEPDEHAAIDAFDQSITDVHSCLGVERLRDALTSRLNCLHCQRIVQTRLVHLASITTMTLSG